MYHVSLSYHVMLPSVQRLDMTLMVSSVLNCSASFIPFMVVLCRQRQDTGTPRVQKYPIPSPSPSNFLGNVFCTLGHFKTREIGKISYFNEFVAFTRQHSPLSAGKTLHSVLFSSRVSSETFDLTGQTLTLFGGGEGETLGLLESLLSVVKTLVMV